MIHIITRADDAGSFTSANYAIMEAYKKGIVRNGSFVVPAERFEEAAEMFCGEKGFCAGLHATLTCEWSSVRWRPVLPPEEIASIIRNDGTFHYTTMDLFGAGIRFDQMLGEIQAQLDKARSRGLDIQYIDSHMEFAWVFETTDEHRFAEPLQRWAEKEGLVWYGHHLHPIPPDASTAADFIEESAEWIRSLHPGTYLLVGHPCYNDEEMRETAIAGQPPGVEAMRRDLQRRMFTDEAILNACKDAGAVPISYIEAERLRRAIGNRRGIRCPFTT